MADLEQSTGVSNPLMLIQSMIDKGSSPDILEKMLGLAERWQANQAKAAYHEAMSACQSEMPCVVARTTNRRTNKLYANLETVQAVAKPVYSAHGFSLSFGEEDSPLEGHARVIVDVRHKAGHVERYRGDFPIDGKGAKGGEVMNAVQGHVSTLTYAKRALLCSVFNVTVADTDLDGEPTNQYATAADITAINDAINDCAEAGKPVDVKRFFKWLGVESLDQLDRAGVRKALLELRRKAGTKEGER